MDTELKFAWIVRAYWHDWDGFAEPEVYGLVWSNRWLSFRDICDQVHRGPDASRIEAIEVERVLVPA